MQLGVPRYFWIWLCMGLVMPSLACALSIFEDDPTPQVNTVSTNNWVSYVGRGVQIGAPPDGWLQVPFDLPVALDQQNDLTERFPTVANVYRYLVLTFTTEEKTALVLMRLDASSWLIIEREDVSGTDFNSRLAAIQQGQLAQGIGIQDEQTIQTGAGQTVRWEVAYSPQGSQIVNRQLHYAIDHGNSLIHMTFTAQAADFPVEKPVFETMANTLVVFG